MAGELMLRHDQHPDRLEHRERAQLAVAADRRSILDGFVVVGQQLGAVAPQLGDDPAMHQTMRGLE